MFTKSNFGDTKFRKKVKTLKHIFNLNQYKILYFVGPADGVGFFRQLFSNDLIVGKYIVVKAVRFTYYVSELFLGGVFPFGFVNDTISLVAGANTRYLLKPAGGRIIPDDGDTYIVANNDFIKFQINGTPYNIFTKSIEPIPAYSYIDNINAVVTDKINNKGIQFSMLKEMTMPDGTTFPPFVVAELETYIIGSLDELQLGQKGLLNEIKRER